MVNYFIARVQRTPGLIRKVASVEDIVLNYKSIMKKGENKAYVECSSRKFNFKTSYLDDNIVDDYEIEHFFKVQLESFLELVKKSGFVPRIKLEREGRFLGYYKA